jgi:serine/threonine protein kinase
MAWQLLVVDGADKDRFFPLLGEGMATIGSSRKNADIVLHDLYVARVHCQIGVVDERVMVADLDSASGTFVNGQKVTQQEMRQGDVLRVGNSHLRLDVYNPEEAAVVEAEEQVYEAEEAVEEKTPMERVAELPGQKLGHYEVGSLLGKGHHGMVFRGRDLKTQQVVALKVFSPEFPANDGEMQPFVKTIKLALALQHAHLVKLMGAGKTGGFCWLVQEYVEGESLTQVLERMGTPGKLTWKHALRLGIHVGQALSFLHKQRHVHSNIAPANILVRFSDKHVKLNDALIIQALEGSALHAAMMKQKLVAEVGYLAPEQTDPGAFQDNSTDIYGLGAVMYARMTCHPPFLGKVPEETITMIRKAKLIRPSEYQEAIPEELEDIVMQMLARRQEERYQRLADVLSDLKAFAEEEEVEV